MNKTLIPWVKNPDGSQGYTWNPITGCLNCTPEGLCKGGNFPCYAYRLANGRLKSRYLANENVSRIEMQRHCSIRGVSNYIDGQALHKALADPFYPRFWINRAREEFGAWTAGAIPKGIFVCDMGDLFGVGVPEEWTRRILNKIGMSYYREHRFYLLTKQAQRLPEFSPFPDNCWVGVTATNRQMYLKATGADGLDGIKAKIKYLSLEPLLEAIHPSEYRLKGIGLVIIGAMTCKAGDILHRGNKYPSLTPMPWGGKWTLQPKIGWVEEMVRACDKAGVPVFLKNNLMPLVEQVFGRENYLSPILTPDGDLRQELPTIKV